MDTLRQVAREFIAGNPLPTDGQLSFEPPYTGSSSVSLPQGPATAVSAQPSGAGTSCVNSMRPLQSTSVVANQRAPPGQQNQTGSLPGTADPLLGELLTPEFLLECTPNQVAAIEPLYRRLTALDDASEADDEDRRRSALAAKFPAIFAQPSPRAASRAANPAVDARRTLSFANPGLTTGNSGLNAGTGVFNAGTGALTAGAGVLTTGSQSATPVASRSSNQSVEEWLEQKISAALASKEQKQSTAFFQEDSAFGTDSGTAVAPKNGVAPECKVPIFKRGNRDMTIENWFFQMRNYFETYSVDRGHWVNICVTRIHTSHFREIAPLLCYNYFKFRSECIKLFETPDLTQAYLSELTELAQAKDEDYETYYERVRDLICKAHPFMSVPERESIMVSYYTKGLYDSRVRDVVAATPGISLAEALRRSSSVAASRRRSEPSGPPVRRVWRDRPKESETTYSSNYARADAEPSSSGGQSQYWQVSEQSPNAGNQYEERRELYGASTEGAGEFSSEVGEDADQCDQFAYSQARGSFRGGRGLFRGRGGGSGSSKVL